MPWQAMFAVLKCYRNDSAQLISKMAVISLTHRSPPPHFILHSSLFTPLSPLFTQHSSLLTLHSALFSLSTPYTLHSSPSTLLTLLSSLSTNPTLHTLRSSHSSPSTLLIDHTLIFHTPHTPCFPLSTSHIIHSLFSTLLTLHTPHSSLLTLHTPHSPQSSPSTLFSFNSSLFTPPLLTLYSSLSTHCSPLLTLQIFILNSSFSNSSLSTPYSPLLTHHLFILNASLSTLHSLHSPLSQEHYHHTSKVLASTVVFKYPGPTA